MFDMTVLFDMTVEILKQNQNIHVEPEHRYGLFYCRMLI